MSISNEIEQGPTDLELRATHGEQIYREVHALCVRHLDDGADADAVAAALLGNAVRGLMERYGIAEARKIAEDFLHGFLDRAACDPDYEHLLGVPEQDRTERGGNCATEE